MKAKEKETYGTSWTVLITIFVVVVIGILLNEYVVKDTGDAKKYPAKMASMFQPPYSVDTAKTDTAVSEEDNPLAEKNIHW